jgi:hypothetical protein
MIPGDPKSLALQSDKLAAATSDIDTDFAGFERYQRDEPPAAVTSREDVRQAFFAGADHGRSQMAELLKRSADRAQASRDEVAAIVRRHGWSPNDECALNGADALLSRYTLTRRTDPS